MGMSTRRIFVFVYLEETGADEFERKPFRELREEFEQFFGGMAGFQAALRDDDTYAEHQARRIIAEQVRDVRDRIARDHLDKVEWDDHEAITNVIPVLRRRAADLRFLVVIGR